MLLASITSSWRARESLYCFLSTIQSKKLSRSKNTSFNTSRVFGTFLISLYFYWVTLQLCFICIVLWSLVIFSRVYSIIPTNMQTSIALVSGKHSSTVLSPLQCSSLGSRQAVIHSLVYIICSVAQTYTFCFLGVQVHKFQQDHDPAVIHTCQG